MLTFTPSAHHQRPSSKIGNKWVSTVRQTTPTTRLTRHTRHLLASTESTLCRFFQTTSIPFSFLSNDVNTVLFSFKRSQYHFLFKRSQYRFPFQTKSIPFSFQTKSIPFPLQTKSISFSFQNEVNSVSLVEVNSDNTKLLT